MRSKDNAYKPEDFLGIEELAAFLKIKKINSIQTQLERQNSTIQARRQESAVPVSGRLRVSG